MSKPSPLFRPTRLTLGYVSQRMYEEDYVLLSDRYINAFQVLKCVCPNKHTWSTSWNKWSIGRRCKYCNGHTLYLNDIKIAFEREGFCLITENFKNAHQKLEYICPNNHRHSISWNNWKKGARCPFCSGMVKKTISFVRKELEESGYILLSNEYKNDSQKLRFICPNGHSHKISWGEWKQGRRCRFCSNNVSRWEREVKIFLRNRDFRFISNDRSQIRKPSTNRPMELDLWFPDVRKAIACNGSYWHNKNKAISNDSLKRELCQQCRILLLTISDEEWKKNREKVENKILSFLE